MSFVEVRTSSLIGPALDWAVAKCNGVALVPAPFTDAKNFVILGQNMKPTSSTYTPSTSWAQGGPIIEREIESLYEHKPLECWAAKSKQGDLRYGPTPLIAAMRCYVATKLGDAIRIPKELLIPERITWTSKRRRS